MNIGLAILGYGIGVFLGGVLSLIPSAFQWITDKVKEHKERKEAEVRWQARLKEYEANGGWLPVDK